MQEPTRSIVRAAAALAIVAVVMWQLKERRDADVAARPAVAVAPKPAPGAQAAASSAASTELRAEAGKSSIVEEAERAVALAKAQEEAAAKAESGEATKAAKAIVLPERMTTSRAADAAAKAEPAAQRKTGTPPITAEPAPAMMSDRTKLVVQTEAAPPSVSGPGVRPMPRSTQDDEKAVSYPSFPGCRWATPTQWVCDGAKQ